MQNVCSCFRFMIASMSSLRCRLLDVKCTANIKPKQTVIWILVQHVTVTMALHSHTLSISIKFHFQSSDFPKLKLCLGHNSAKMSWSVCHLFRLSKQTVIWNSKEHSHSCFNRQNKCKSLAHLFVVLLILVLCIRYFAIGFFLFFNCWQNIFTRLSKAAVIWSWSENIKHGTFVKHGKNTKVTAS